MKTRKQFLWSSIAVGILVGVFYFLCVKYNIFFIVPWFDKPMHLLGGCAIGYMGMFLFGGRPFQKRILPTATLALWIGIGWEIFERIGNAYAPAFIQYGGRLDTVTDVLCAILGASFIIVMNHNHD